MSNLFNSIRVRKPKYNRFNLSHSVKMTMKGGILTPFFCQPTVPGDVWKMNTEALLRFAPFQFPIMHRVNVYTHFFFVPNRLVWSQWKKFYTGGEDGKSNEDIFYPRYVVSSTALADYADLFKEGSLLDYLGFPVGAFKEGSVIDVLPIIAYALIYDEYYRDQNLTDPLLADGWIDFDFTTTGYFSDHAVNVVDADGVVTSVPSSPQGLYFLQNLLNLQKRAWKKDYFTSALPWAQRGDEVQLPLAGSADLLWNDGAYSDLHVSDINAIEHTGASRDTLGSERVNITGNSDPGRIGYFVDSGAGNPYFEESRLGYLPKDASLGNGFQLPTARLGQSDLKKMIGGVDLSNVSSATINELRRAIKAQEFLELAARGGSRYIEQIYAYFGVRSSDARLQRPEFLGGGKSPVVISDVLQTSQSTENSPQASPAGHGVSVQRSHSFKRFFEEPGYIIGIISVMPMPAYQQGMPRVYQKFDRLDYYWPQFAHLGEQEIKESEIYYQGNAAEDEKVFGYAPRYAEYKFINDSVHGDFRTSLNAWHMGRIFGNAPKLNEDFVTNVQDAFNRPFALQKSEIDKIWVNIQNNCYAKRLMPKYGTPLF